MNSTYYCALILEQCMEKQTTPQDSVICSTTFSSNKLN